METLLKGSAAPTAEVLEARPKSVTSTDTPSLTVKLLCTTHFSLHRLSSIILINFLLLKSFTTFVNYLVKFVENFVGKIYVKKSSSKKIIFLFD